MYEAPAWIQDELRAIDPGYFAIYDHLINRWQIRVWKTLADKDTRFPYYRAISHELFTVRKEDNHGHDIGFIPLDMRVINTIRASNYNKERIKHLIANIDEHNEKIIRRGKATDYLLARDLAKNLWHHFQEPTVFVHRGQ